MTIYGKRLISKFMRQSLPIVYPPLTRRQNSPVHCPFCRYNISIFTSQFLVQKCTSQFLLLLLYKKKRSIISTLLILKSEFEFTFYLLANHNTIQIMQSFWNCNSHKDSKDNPGFLSKHRYHNRRVLHILLNL